MTKPHTKPAATLMAESAAVSRPADAPHRLMSPDDLEVALDCADVLDGELPHWHRDPDPVSQPDRVPSGEKFERDLEDAKREPAGLPPLTGEEWHMHRMRLLG